MADHSDSKDLSSDFSSSKLGTKEYWDQAYERELENFSTNGDVGEIWFGKSAQNRVCDWLVNCPDVSEESRIVDIGCGNGAFVLEMTKRGFSNCVGVDYSQQAVTLATKVATAQGVCCQFQECDVVAEPLPDGPFDVCVDKGTYDAISLCPERSEDRRNRYIKNVAGSLSKDGRLVMTSCNWTADELAAHFQADFEVEAKIPSPSFSFGGQTGSRESSIVFRKQC